MIMVITPQPEPGSARTTEPAFVGDFMGISDLMTDVQTLQTPKDKEMNEMLTELAGLMCLGGL